MAADKTETSTTSDSSSTYQITVKGAVPNSTYTVYLNNESRRVNQGQTKTADFTIAIPANIKGEGSVEIGIPRVSRNVYNRQISKQVTLEPGLIIDISDEVNPKPMALASSNKKHIKNALQEKVQHTKKDIRDIVEELEDKKPEIEAAPKRKFLTNTIREKREKSKVDSTDKSENNEKKSFWDKL